MSGQPKISQPVEPASRPKSLASSRLCTAEARVPIQRVGVLVEIPRVLREMGVDTAPILASFGEHRAALSDMDAWLPFPVISDLIIQCIEATGREDFPLVVGASARMRHWGIMGKLLSSAQDLRAALVEFVANHPRYARGGSAYLVDYAAGGLLLAYRVHYPGLRGSGFFSLGAMAFGRSVLSELCGAEPAGVLLSLPEPEDLAPYKQAFGRAKLVFEAEHFGLLYSRSALAKAIPTADPVVHADIQKVVAERWSLLEPDIQDRVMRVLVPSVLAGTPSLRATADLLAIHPRTLNRALERRGVSFRDAVNEARFEMASQLLRDTRVSVGNLAEILGYSEVSAFTRFFTSMAGQSPSEWKQAELVRPRA
jgi:AraC-like DNA-binding protein